MKPSKAAGKPGSSTSFTTQRTVEKVAVAPVVEAQ